MNQLLHFRCETCGAINRVPAERISAGPTCGRCKAAVPTAGAPVNLSDDELTRLTAASPIPVLVDFWAPSCGPCKAVAPHLEALGKRHAGRLIIAKINTDEHGRTASELRVQAIPTLAIWKGGRLITSAAGALMGASLEAFVAPHL